ncbi:MAG: hypothetical protein IKW45_04685 [Clostridia bacterium]|nr:hypothetical protein [Clostridia bacterium]
MKKWLTPKMLIAIVFIIEMLGLYFWETIIGKVMFVVGFVVGIIISFYNYKKKIISKNNFLIFIVFSIAFAACFILSQLFISNFSTSYFSDVSIDIISRFMRRLLMLGVAVYLYKLDN